jgi:RNA polymerase sigma-70 factor (ECF subfamily)
VKVVMVQAPEVSAFQRFFADEFARLVPALHALTGDRARAEDLAQEALDRAHRNWSTVGAYERPGAWVRRVAFNLASNAARSSRREEAALRRVPPAGVTELPEADERLWALVRELPEQQRWAVVLHYVEDRPVAEVATVLEVSDGTVKTHLSRARATLAARLAATGGDGDA